MRNVSVVSVEGSRHHRWTERRHTVRYYPPGNFLGPDRQGVAVVVVGEVDPICAIQLPIDKPTT
jgi:hypothetical protein